MQVRRRQEPLLCLREAADRAGIACFLAAVGNYPLRGVGLGHLELRMKMSCYRALQTVARALETGNQTCPEWTC